jgi:hypothetical protein
MTVAAATSCRTRTVKLGRWAGLVEKTTPLIRMAGRVRPEIYDVRLAFPNPEGRWVLTCAKGVPRRDARSFPCRGR